jgi:hypothetical protein
MGGKASRAGDNGRGSGFGRKSPLQRRGIVEVGHDKIRHAKGFEFGAVAGRTNHRPDPSALIEEGLDDVGTQRSGGSYDCDYRRLHDYLPPLAV